MKSLFIVKTYLWNRSKYCLSYIKRLLGIKTSQNEFQDNNNYVQVSSGISNNAYPLKFSIINRPRNGRSGWSEDDVVLSGKLWLFHDGYWNYCTVRLNSVLSFMLLGYTMASAMSLVYPMQKRAAFPESRIFNLAYNGGNMKRNFLDTVKAGMAYNAVFSDMFNILSWKTDF